MGYTSLYKQTWDDFLEMIFARLGYKAEGTEGFRTPLWDFTRLVKGHRTFRKKSGIQALQSVEQWRRQRQHEWEQFPGITSAEDARMEFLSIWDNIRFVPGEEPLDIACERADRSPVALTKRHERTPGYGLFVSMCYWLQTIRREEKRIFLPGCKLGSLLCVDPRTITRYKQSAVQDGFLRLEKKHSYHPDSNTRRAAEYRLDLRLFVINGDKIHERGNR